MGSGQIIVTGEEFTQFILRYLINLSKILIIEMHRLII